MTTYLSSSEPSFDFLIEDGVVWLGVPIKFFYDHLDAFGAAFAKVAKKDTKGSKGSKGSFEYNNVVVSNDFYDPDKNNSWYWNDK